jgi:uncharacterized protein YoaH (UPF0181 family)
MTLTSGKRVTSGAWAEYVNGSIDSAVRQINGVIAQGFQRGQTVGQMAKTIRESTQGILKGNAEVLARTGQSHYANQAREAMALDNRRVIKYRVFVATLDISTTDGCRKFDLNSWDIDDQSYPRLPLHHGERSIYVYTNDLSKIKQGSRASVGGRADAKIEPGQKLKYRGKKDLGVFNPKQLESGETMQQFMTRQPDWFLEEALGPKRAKLFRDGGLTIDKFADVTGRSLTLAELRDLDAAAFKRAGL